MNKRFSTIPFLALFLALPVGAESDAGLQRLLSLSLEDLMSIKVKISTNTNQTLSKAPSVVSVITAEDIRATGATNLTEVLQGVPGLYVRANLFGFRPQVTFRGAAGTHTLLMVNGKTTKDLVWSSGIFWKGLPTSMIERVEIIRGPGSALFGSDASAGVINVITRTAGRIEQSEVGVRAGSFDSQAGWLRHGASWNGFDVGFTAEISHTDGHNPLIVKDAQTTKDASTGTAVSYAPGYAHYGWRNEDLRFSLAKEHWRLHVDYVRHSNAETGLTGAGVLDPLTSGSDSRYDIDLFYNDEAFTPSWGFNAELRYHHLDYTSGNGFQERPPGYKDTLLGTAYANGVLNLQRAAEHGLSVEVSGLYTGINQHAIRVGGGHSLVNLYSVEHFTNQGKGPNGVLLPANSPLVDVSDSPYAFAPEKRRKNNYLYFQDIWTLAANWELTAGARYDHYSDFGDSLNPRLALVWQSSDRLTTKLMYGQAFRAPSYLELYSQTSANIPNPNLTPERSNTWDLSFSYLAAKDLRLGLGIYQFAQTNLIAADPARKFQNLGDRTSRGLELEAQWKASRSVRVTGNLTHIDESDTTFPRSVPKNKAYLRTDWTFLPDWNWNIQANWIGQRPLPAADPRDPLHASTLVDTTIRYSHRADWEFAASVRNLLNVDAREYTSSAIPNNLPLPGRSFHAEMRYQF